MISFQEQSDIARNLEPHYNAELKQGAAPGVFGVSFSIPSPGRLDVTLQLTGLTATRPYVCDENDTANTDSYRAAVDWCYRDALNFVNQPVTFEEQRAMAENVEMQMRAELPTMPDLSGIEIRMLEKDLLKISLTFTNGIRTGRNYRAAPADNRNPAAFAAFLNRAFTEFSHRPQSEVRREVAAQMGVRPKSPWATVLTVILVLIAIASVVGIFFLIIAVLVGAGLSENERRGSRRRRWW